MKIKKQQQVQANLIKDSVFSSLKIKKFQFGCDT